MKLLLFTISYLFISGVAHTQSGSAWDTLTMVTSRQAYNPELGFVNVDIELSPEVEAMDGRIIEVDGYIIPLTAVVGHNNFMFSMYPSNMCFFCGAAGPESAMEVFMAGKNSVPFTSDRISLRGRLNINMDDATGLIYSLEGASRID